MPYFITNFPGCGDREAASLSSFLGRHGWTPQQTQDIIPLPMTVASAMYFEGMDWEGRALHVNRGLAERRPQRGAIAPARRK